MPRKIENWKPFWTGGILFTILILAVRNIRAAEQGRYLADGEGIGLLPVFIATMGSVLYGAIYIWLLQGSKDKSNVTFHGAAGVGGILLLEIAAHIFIYR